MLWWTYQQLRMSSLKTRLAIVHKLSHSDCAESVGPLTFALQDRDPSVRAAAALGIGILRDHPSVNALIKLLKDPAPEPRAAAVEALGVLGDPVAVNAMVGLLLDPAPAVRTATSFALEKLGWHPGDDSQRVLQILAMGRISAAASMGAEAVAPLMEMMRTGTPAKQFEAVKTLGQIDDPRVKGAMLEALKKDHAATQIAALGTLERLGAPDALEAIEKTLTNSNPSVRGAAVEAAISCGKRNAVPALLRMLKDDSWEVRSATAKALGALGDAAAVNGVAELLDDEDRDVRETAIKALGRIGSRRAVPQLVLALIDKETTVRNAAAATLKVVDSRWELNRSVRLVLPKIKAALDHHEYWVRHSATKLFADLQIDPEAVTEQPVAAVTEDGPPHPAFDILAELLFDHDPDLRLAAAEALRRLRKRSALPLLNAAAQDADPLVQQAARAAVAELG
jgi:HEAT repeat protein